MKRERGEGGRDEPDASERRRARGLRLLCGELGVKKGVW